MRLIEEHKKWQLEYEDKIKNYIWSWSTRTNDTVSRKQSAGSKKGFQQNPFKRPMSGSWKDKQVDEKD